MFPDWNTIIRRRMRSSESDEVEPSCISQSPEALVTRAVLKLWRVAYHTDSYDPLNTGSNPP